MAKVSVLVLTFGLLGLLIPSPVRAQNKAFEKEIMEWVVAPCMAVAAARDLPKIKKRDLDAGATQESIARLMASSRRHMARDIARLMDKNATWKERADAYPVFLKVCVRGLPGMK